MDGNVYILMVSIVSLATAQTQMSLKPCSDPLSSCIAPPCGGRSCAAYPNAECRNNYCGGCNVEFWVGGQEVTSQCDNTGSSQTVAGATVGNCNGATMRCFANPCNGISCGNFPNAECRTDYCNCKATFWVDTADVTSQCASNTGATKGQSPGVSGSSTMPCSSGLYVQCMKTPCSSSSCPEYPNAQCRNNYCEVCSAEYWDGDMEVTSLCNGGTGPSPLKMKNGNLPGSINNPPTGRSSSSNFLPSSAQPQNCRSSCFMAPCRQSSCPNHPTATCENDYCNACTARYYLSNGQEVTSQCSTALTNNWGLGSNLFRWFPSRNSVQNNRRPLFGFFNRNSNRNNNRNRNIWSSFTNPFAWMWDRYF